MGIAANVAGEGEGVAVRVDSRGGAESDGSLIGVRTGDVAECASAGDTVTIERERLGTDGDATCELERSTCCTDCGAGRCGAKGVRVGSCEDAGRDGGGADIGIVSGECPSAGALLGNPRVPVTDCRVAATGYRGG